ncbi:TonB-dependent receptor [Algoriphagus pacificus]|uniref:TonB-dependent receptor n=1 Tax=Algoriphagus pacificus TaxID=2811234 RepID=A0ABS3CLQ3_9BACT|nr:TonB-dependent receptor [Algoriphagus pacificus]MBN7817695.1 TonB-dependent receptor [Algoriphagus pacificus]
MFNDYTFIRETKVMVSYCLVIFSRLIIKIILYVPFLTLFLVSEDAFTQESPIVSIKQIETTFTPGVRHSVVFEVNNVSNTELLLTPSFSLPESWTLITAGSQFSLKAREKELILVTFFIPVNENPGHHVGRFRLKNITNGMESAIPIEFFIEDFHNIQLRTISAPLNIQAGETIETIFEIRNEGNVPERLSVKSSNELKDKAFYIIPPDSAVLVRVNEKSRAQANSVQLINCELVVTSEASGKTIKSFSTTRVFPSKLPKSDAYFRFPVEASVYQNIYGNGFSNQNSRFFELSGAGFLDLKKQHRLDFIIRAPNQSNLTRFGVNDQYSLVYRNADRTKVYFGDHVFNISRLGFIGRYGFGARLDQRVGRFEFSGFFTKPRLSSYSKEPIYGVKAQYFLSSRLTLGLSSTGSKEISQYYSYSAVKSAGKAGQIVSFSTTYKDEKTQAQLEVASSISTSTIDFAGDLNVSRSFGNFSYRGGVTMAGEEFFGSLSNSLQYSNGLSYNLKKWYFSIGQGYSKVHERIDTTMQAVLPYFENYYGSIGHNINESNYFNIRADFRSREDKGERAIFNYDERGIDYRYKFFKGRFTLNFNGRVSQTRNLLSDDRQYRNTSSEFLNVNYRLSSWLTIRGNFNHNKTNRYNITNVLSHYYLYGGGFNANINQILRVGANYNSGFSPEEAYNKRDFVNANAMIRIGQNHQFEARLNYYMIPNQTSNKEMFAFLKYTFKFGAPLKKVLKQGSVRGIVTSNDPSIELKGIQVIASGRTVRTDSQGRFEFNNLLTGNGYILVDESTLPSDGVLVSSLPYEVKIQEGQKTEIVLEVTRGVNLAGKLQVVTDDSLDLSAYLKLESDARTYFIESDKTGSFDFKKIIPGKYNLSIIRMKSKLDLEPEVENIAVDTTIDNGLVVFNLKTKERKIIIKSKDFEIGN